jgi:hypothetical protein
MMILVALAGLLAWGLTLLDFTTPGDFDLVKAATYRSMAKDLQSRAGDPAAPGEKANEFSRAAASFSRAADTLDPHHRTGW